MFTVIAGQRLSGIAHLRRRVGVLLACLVVTALAMTALSSPADAATQTASSGPQTNFPQKIINVGSNKCFEPMEPSGHLEWAGIPVKQRTCFLDFAPQTWTFESKGFVKFNDQSWWCINCVPNGTEGFFIKNRQTGQCLDARDGATNDGSVVQQWTCQTAASRSMVWYVQPGSYPNSFRIRNFRSDLCLDVAGGSGNDYVQIQQYHCTSNNPAQNFYQGLWPRGE